MPENHYHIVHNHRDTHYHFYTPTDVEETEYSSVEDGEEEMEDKFGVTTPDIDDDPLL